MVSALPSAKAMTYSIQLALFATSHPTSEGGEHHYLRADLSSDLPDGVDLVDISEEVAAWLSKHTPYQWAFDGNGDCWAALDGRTRGEVADGAARTPVLMAVVVAVERLAPRNLLELIVAMRCGLYTDDEWTELPTFGGDAPADTSGVWSWDETDVLGGTCADDIKIVSREEWEATS